MSAEALEAVAAAVARIGAADDPDQAMSVALEDLERGLGLTHSLLLLLDEAGTGLFAVCARGYPEGAAGAEVRVGEGFIGTAARSRVPVRLGVVSRAIEYSRRARMQTAGSGGAVGREIPLPGLPDVESVLAVPLLVRGALVGVLAAESARPLAFDRATEHAVCVVGTALAQQLTLLGVLAIAEAEPAADVATAAESPDGRVREVDFFLADDSVFVDHAYVIKGVAGRILVKLLREQAAGRREFTNRELRLDRWLQLPPIHDNLENRLLLLRQRLADAPFGIHLVRTGRGRFAVQVEGRVRVTEHV